MIDDCTKGIICMLPFYGLRKQRILQGLCCCGSLFCVYHIHCGMLATLHSMKEDSSILYLALELEPQYLKAILRKAQANEALEKYEDALEGQTRWCLI